MTCNNEELKVHIMWYLTIMHAYTPQGKGWLTAVLVILPIMTKSLAVSQASTFLSFFPAESSVPWASTSRLDTHGVGRQRGTPVVLPLIKYIQSQQKDFDIWHLISIGFYWHIHLSKLLQTHDCFHHTLTCCKSLRRMLLWFSFVSVNFNSFNPAVWEDWC